jgi:Flp pilus assembly protein RcpC/CpaB
MRAAIRAIALVAAFSSGIARAQSRVGSGYAMPEGTSAVTIRQYDLKPDGASIQLGELIDLLAVCQNRESHQEAAKVILQYKLVYGINLGRSDTADRKTTHEWLTIAVKPDQVGMVEAADRAGVLRVLLRPRDSQEIMSDEEVAERGFGHFRDIGLAYLRERYPNIDPHRFGYQKSILVNGEITVVFVDRDSRWQSPQGSATYRTQYFVRVKLNDELVGIERQERDDGVLKISPAPFDRPYLLKPLATTPPVIIEQPRKDGGIIIIRPEGVPQTVP